MYLTKRCIIYVLLFFTLSCQEKYQDKIFFENKHYLVIYRYKELGDFKNNYFLLRRKIDGKEVDINTDNYSLFFDDDYLYYYSSGKPGKGFWLYVSNDNSQNYDFKYDTIPYQNNLDTSNLEDGVYRILSGNASRLCSLTQLNSFHELSTGFYFVAYPGVLYTKKVKIEYLIDSLGNVSK